MTTSIPFRDAHVGHVDIGCLNGACGDHGLFCRHGRMQILACPKAASFRTVERAGEDIQQLFRRRGGAARPIASLQAAHATIAIALPVRVAPLPNVCKEARAGTIASQLWCSRSRTSGAQTICLPRPVTGAARNHSAKSLTEPPLGYLLADTKKPWQGQGLICVPRKKSPARSRAETQFNRFFLPACSLAG